MKKNGFVLYAQQYESVKHLSLEEKGRLFDAIFQYHILETIPEDLPPVVAMALSFIRTSMDIDYGKYLKRVEANRDNGKRGGRPKKPTGFKKTQPNPKKPIEPKKADKDKDKDKDKGYNLSSDSDESCVYSFGDFWNDYDKKRGDKIKLSKKWDKISDTDKKKIKEYIPRYKAAQPDKQYRKDPATFCEL